MKTLTRLAGLVRLAILAVGLMASASASATGYLLLPVGALVLALSLPGRLTIGEYTIECSSDRFTTEIASVHLIGPFRGDLNGCTASSRSDSDCPANSVGAASGLISTTTLHALIGLGLPGDSPTLLVLPATGKKLATLAASTNKAGTCTPESAAVGTVAGLLLQTVGTKTTKALIDFVPNDPQTIDLPLGGTVTPEIEVFAALGALEAQVHLLYDTPAELMP